MRTGAYLPRRQFVTRVVEKVRQQCLIDRLALALIVEHALAVGRDDVHHGHADTIARRRKTPGPILRLGLAQIQVQVHKLCSQATERTGLDLPPQRNTATSRLGSQHGQDRPPGRFRFGKRLLGGQCRRAARHGDECQATKTQHRRS